MAISAATLTTKLTTFECGQCAGVYAISERYREHKYEKGGYWHCPYCQCSWGYQETEIDRLKKQLAQEKHNAEQRFAAARDALNAERHKSAVIERRRAAMKGQVTRIKNRVGKGVCPCCNRQFQNLHRHMTNQHPDWAPDAETPEAQEAGAAS